MEENRKEIVSDAYIYNTLGKTLTHTLKGKQMDKYAHTYTLTHKHKESMLFLWENCKCKTAEMNHANGMADSCVQYYDFKAPKDWLHNLFFIYLVEENILPRSAVG